MGATLRPVQEVPVLERLLNPERSVALGAAALVVANCVPLVGVLFFGWSVATILVLYWIENGLLGVVNVLKIARVQRASPAAIMTLWIRSSRSTSTKRGRYFVPYFIANYGLFWLIHGFFVAILCALTAEDGVIPIDPIGLLLATICLAVAQAADFRGWLHRDEFEHTTPHLQMLQPYGRLLVLHSVIIVGAFAVILTGRAAALVATLVATKTALDLVLYMRAHRPEPARATESAAKARSAEPHEQRGQERRDAEDRPAL